MFPQLSYKILSKSEKITEIEGRTFADRFFRRSKPTGPEYENFVDEDDEEASIASGDPLPKPEKPKSVWGWGLGAVKLIRYPLYISIIIHAMILVDLIYAHWKSPDGTYLRGFTSDFDFPKGVLKMEKRVFTHSLRARNGSIYANIDEEGPRYVGEPSPDVDENWEELVGGRYIRLTDGEVKKLDKDSSVPNLTPLQHAEGLVDLPGFYGSVDMVHGLHCLNTIRQAQDPDYYEKNLQAPMKHSHRMKMRLHIDHCIDHLRQAILCHGDLTPVTLRPVNIDDPSADLVGETERTHTCRNGLDIRKWLTERGMKNGFLPPKYVDDS